MTYRLLHPAEWGRLTAIFEKHGQLGSLPTPEAAMAAVAENTDGEIVGVLMFQLAFHMEPLILVTPHASFLRLSETIEKAVAEKKGLSYYCFSDSNVVDGMAEKAGFSKTAFSVWKKEVA